MAICVLHLLIHTTWNFGFDVISNLYLHKSGQVTWIKPNRLKNSIDEKMCLKWAGGTTKQIKNSDDNKNVKWSNVLFK
jgi:hypothetical protein